MPPYRKKKRPTEPDVQRAAVCCGREDALVHADQGVKVTETELERL